MKGSSFKKGLLKEDLLGDSDELEDDLMHKSEMNKLVSLWKSMKEVGKLTA